MDRIFDDKDLVFFLYIRSVVQKALGLDFARLQECDLKSIISGLSLPR